MDNVFKQNSAFFGEPYLLTPEQQKNPVSVFNSFFDSMALEEARQCIKELKEAALTSDLQTFSTPRDREDVMYVCWQLEMLIEAAFLVKRNSDKAAN